MSDTYVTAIPAGQLFADHTYQRELDTARVRRMAGGWDRRLVGIIDVSERPDGNGYAVIDGQHRWAAARLADPAAVMVCNVHTGLSVADEAELFDQLNRQRTRITTWDHWKARRSAGDSTVTAIEAAVESLGLRIDPAPKAGNVRCTATLEKLHALGGTPLIKRALAVALEVWGRDTAAYDAPIVHALGLIHQRLAAELDSGRLVLALLDCVPAQLKAQALALRQITPGTTPRLVAVTIMALYNKRPGRKLLVSVRTFGGVAPKAEAAAAG